jgi:hypothetical protein
MAANDNRRANDRAVQDKGVKTCPICGKARDSIHAPFCSRRCADIDLHRWLKGSYVIPGAPAPADDGADDE